MPKLTIDNLQPGTLDGDTLYETAEKVNANFNEIYTVFGDGTTLSQAYTALQGLNAGLIVSQGLNTYTSREIKSLTSSIQVTNGTGAQGDPTLDLSSTGVLPAGSAPTLQADQGFTVDVQGRITALSTPTLLTNVTAQADAASASASTASTKASEAAASATTAASDVATIGTSLSQAATHATNAGNSASSAGTSASTATTQAGLATTNGAAQVTLATAQKDLAIAQVALAEDEKDAAVIAKNASVAAKDDSVIAKNAAVVAKDASVDAKNLAETAKTASENAKTAAETASSAAAASFDSFDDRYLGAKSSAPSVDNDGNALITGALYFDSTGNELKIWSGSAWQVGATATGNFLVKSNNLNDLTSASTALTNLGLDPLLAAKAPLSGANFAGGASAPMIGGTSIKAVATSGAYSDLSGKPDLSIYAPINNPTFTGTVAGPTINASTALQIGGVAISASAAEINYNNVTTLGTTEASKTVTADANGVVTFDFGKIEESTAITSSSNAATLNLRDGDNFTHTLSENVTYTFSNPAANGKVSAFTLKVTQDSSARVITWPNSVDWAAATAPTLSATSGAVDVFAFFTSDGGTTYYGFTAGQALG